MKRFLIHVSTNWCGMDNTFRAMAESELDLYDTAEYLAYDNFQSYGCDSDIAEEEGYDPDEMEDSDYASRIMPEHISILIEGMLKR